MAFYLHPNVRISDFPQSTINAGVWPTIRGSTKGPIFSLRQIGNQCFRQPTPGQSEHNCSKNKNESILYPCPLFFIFFFYFVAVVCARVGEGHEIKASDIMFSNYLFGGNGWNEISRPLTH